MQKHELLVPAGNMECLKQAVYNGCDAVYLACKNFGARKFAANFDEKEILEAIRFCHLYGVRIYVTMNTLVKDNEVSSFLDQVDFLHRSGVDALIVQDFGMICLLREMYPNLEIHASTQANISSKDICQLYYNLGVKRVVFSRELTIDEIDSIDVPIEKEAFIHGALCISYSGCCLMSSMLGGRSGNRGECAGVCRMPFQLFDSHKAISNKEYLLSTKELNTSCVFDRLLHSNIYSFKIEGRMKGPLYVGFITNLYRKLIDGEDINLEEETKKLKTIFNREFTCGRMFMAKDHDFMNILSPNHVGLRIGKVIGVTKEKIKIQLDAGCILHQQDAIRFYHSQDGFIVNYLYDSKEKLISSSNSICYVDNKIRLREGDIVMKTYDYLLDQEYLKKEMYKIPVSFQVVAKINHPLQILIDDGKNSIMQEGNIVIAAEKTPVTCENIENQLKKLGNTPFNCKDISITMDSNIFISLRELNEMRRFLVEQLISARTSISTIYDRRDVHFLKTNHHSSKDVLVSCYVHTEEQLKKCLELEIGRIYVGNENLYNRYKKYSSVFYYIPRCVFSPKEMEKEKSLVSDYANYSFETVGNYSLNVMNSYTAYYLEKIGIYPVCLSVELTEDECLTLMENFCLLFGTFFSEILVYGRVENMIIKGNILNIQNSLFQYHLLDSKNRSFPVYYDGRITHILNWEKQKMDISKFFGKSTIRFDFYEETAEEIEKILKTLESYN